MRATEEARKREREAKIKDEKRWLLSLTDGEAEKLTVAERYQRIRYLREVEARSFVYEQISRLPPTTELKPKRYRKQFDWYQD